MAPEINYPLRIALIMAGPLLFIAYLWFTNRKGKFREATQFMMMGAVVLPLIFGPLLIALPTSKSVDEFNARLTQTAQDQYGIHTLEGHVDRSDGDALRATIAVLQDGKLVELPQEIIGDTLVIYGPDNKELPRIDARETS